MTRPADDHYPATKTEHVEGFGFFGAGITLRGQAGIHGLTTAASLWASAAGGMLVGFGLYVLALITTAVVLLILVIRAVDPIARKLEEIREENRVEAAPASPDDRSGGYRQTIKAGT